MAREAPSTALAPVIFDTDVLVYYLRGDQRAADFVRSVPYARRKLSAVAYNTTSRIGDLSALICSVVSLAQTWQALRPQPSARTEIIPWGDGCPWGLKARLLDWQPKRGPKGRPNADEIKLERGRLDNEARICYYTAKLFPKDEQRDAGEAPSSHLEGKGVPR